MTIGQEQLMKLFAKREEENAGGGGQRNLPDSVFWRIVYNAFYLWLAAVVGICAWIAIFG